jgi:hypothetical protein
MGIPFIYVERDINPTEPHDVKFKPENPSVECGEFKYVIEKPKCSICGATEETEICNRTFVS